MYSAFVHDAEFTIIEAARHREMTTEEREEQRRSFAYGNAASENPLITRAMIDRAAERMKREKERAAEA